MVFDIMILGSSLYCIYEYLTYTGILDMPYISLSGHENIYLVVMKVCAMKYSLLFALIGVLFVIGNIFLKESINYLSFKVKVAFAYIMLGVLMLL